MSSHLSSRLCWNRCARVVHCCATPHNREGGTDMPIFKRDDVELYYEEHGAGFPILLIAPGGMRSAVAFWERTPCNPIKQLAPHYRVIAMDQRNAGQLESFKKTMYSDDFLFNVS